MIITSSLKIPSNQASITVPYKVDKSSDGNIIHLHIYKKIFPTATKEQLAATKNNNIQLKLYNRTAITQLSMCKLKLQHHYKQKNCKFFVVPGNGQALLGMLTSIH